MEYVFSVLGYKSLNAIDNLQSIIFLMVTITSIIVSITLLKKGVSKVKCL